MKQAVREGFSIAKDAVHALLGHLADAFLVHSVWLAADHPRARLVLLTPTPEGAGDVPPQVRVVDAAVWFLGSSMI